MPNIYQFTSLFLSLLAIGIAFAGLKVLERTKKNYISFIQQRAAGGTSFPQVTRVEVIGNGREYTNYSAKNVSLQLQDEGRTLKVFLSHSK